MANGRCRKHGGLTPSGPASPHWKTGLRSKDLPARLSATFETFLADIRLDLLKEIALTEAMMVDRARDIDLDDPARVTELRELIETKMRLVVEQNKEQARSRKAVTAKELGAFVAAVYAAIRSEVDDPGSLDRIRRHIATAISGGIRDDPRALSFVPGD